MFSEARQEVMGKVPDLGYRWIRDFYHAGRSQNSEVTVAALRRGLLKYDHDHGYRGAEAQV